MIIVFRTPVVKPCQSNGVIIKILTWLHPVFKSGSEKNRLEYRSELSPGRYLIVWLCLEINPANPCPDGAGNRIHGQQPCLQCGHILPEAVGDIPQ